jgi:hypothetical protein
MAIVELAVPLAPLAGLANDKVAPEAEMGVPKVRFQACAGAIAQAVTTKPSTNFFMSKTPIRTSVRRKIGLISRTKPRRPQSNFSHIPGKLCAAITDSQCGRRSY